MSALNACTAQRNTAAGRPAPGDPAAAAAAAATAATAAKVLRRPAQLGLAA
ncbi:MAG: hypothetical protein JNJ60_17415 [Rhodocyclaceae bacterium]|nr:hypothetical protein [Rhodocyclaceae bacterium]